MKPLCIDLFCGLGGWTEGFLAEGWDVIGFDIEQHVYGAHRYPAQLVLQDVRTIHGSQFKDADMIVASSPCQEFSYRAMPWKRAKALGPPLLGMELFSQAARIQREACEAAGHHIPMIQENVRGAQKYVGRAAHHFGSYYLWGDVPALMPATHRGVKVPGMDWPKYGEPGYKAVAFNDSRHTGGRRTDVGKGARFTSRDCGAESGAIKGEGGGWFNDNKRSGKDSTTGILSRSGSKSAARKESAARIAKIPAPLARHIAQVYYPRALP
jgi:hypothetical protein